MSVRPCAVAAALALAGCASSSTDGRDFDGLSDAVDAMNTRIAALPAAATLPPGSATYTGLARIDVIGPDTLVLVGDATLSADFDAGSVSGALSRFVASGDGPVSGSIAMTGGTISDAFIDGLTVAGDLGVGGRTLAFRGTGSGKFTGPPARRPSSRWAGSRAARASPTGRAKPTSIAADPLSAAWPRARRKAPSGAP